MSGHVTRGVTKKKQSSLDGSCGGGGFRFVLDVPKSPEDDLGKVIVVPGHFWQGVHAEYYECKVVEYDARHRFGRSAESPAVRLLVLGSTLHDDDDDDDDDERSRRNKNRSLPCGSLCRNRQWMRTEMQAA